MFPLYAITGDMGQHKGWTWFQRTREIGHRWKQVSLWRRTSQHKAKVNVSKEWYIWTFSVLGKTSLYHTLPLPGWSFPKPMWTTSSTNRWRVCLQSSGVASSLCVKRMRPCSSGLRNWERSWLALRTTIGRNSKRSSYL